MRNPNLIDRSFAGRSLMLRAPDLRLLDVESTIVAGRRSFAFDLEAPGRSLFIYVLSGTFEYTPRDGSETARTAPAGTALGIEDGRPFCWTVSAHAADDGPAELFVSSIPRRVAILQKLTGGMIVVPPDAEPYAQIIDGAVALQAAQFRRNGSVPSDPVSQRCAEICLLQFIAYARAGLAAATPAPHSLTHDEQLLAAWTAYFADPRRRWTVQDLADAAGMGRTAFALRFRQAFGDSPLHALTALRLEQAEVMLRDGNTPLIEIAFTVGYNSEAAFVRAFQRHHGITPGRYRAGEPTLRGRSEHPG